MVVFQFNVMRLLGRVGELQEAVPDTPLEIGPNVTVLQNPTVVLGDIANLVHREEPVLKTQPFVDEDQVATVLPKKGFFCSVQSWMWLLEQCEGSC